MRYNLEAIGHVAVSDRFAKGAFISSCVVTAIYAATSLALPFGWDHGIMASVGSSYIQGALPYVDSWDMKGPVSYLPYALVEALFGPTMWGIRIFDFIVSAIASFIFYSGVSALTTRRIGAWAAFALYYWVAAAGWFFTAAPDSWAGSLCVIAIVPLLTPNKALRNWHLFASGVLVGCVGLIKPIYFAVGMGPLLSIMFTQNLMGWQRARLTLALAAGAAAPIVLVCGYFAWRGGLSQAIEVHVLYPLSAYVYIHEAPPLKAAVYGFAAFFARPAVALLTPFVALGIWAIRRQPQALLPCLSWLVVMVFAVAMQGKYYFYHWLPVYAPLLLLAAVGSHVLVSVGRGAVSLIFTLSAASVFIAQVSALPFYDAAKFIYYFGVERTPESYYASFQFNTGTASNQRIYNAEDELAAARYIDAHTKPDDSVFVWGNDATARYLANRANPSRFTFEMPLSLQGPYLARYRAEAMRDLRARPPIYFIVGINWWAIDTKEQSIAKFAEMATFLHQCYRLEKSFGALDLYRLNAPAE